MVAAAHQAITREWWDVRRGDFLLLTSQLVIEECSAGDALAAQLRLETLAGIPLIPWSDQVERIANELMKSGLIPEKAAADGLHIGYAAVNGIDYLLTWNCRHLANAERWPSIAVLLQGHGLAVSVVCTPEELMGDRDDNGD